MISPLMQGDAVHVHQWMTAQRFLAAVALGQITPGPVLADPALHDAKHGGRDRTCCLTFGLGEPADTAAPAPALTAA